MYEVQNEVEKLENMRTRAQISYGIFAGGLLIAVLMAFLSNIIWAAVIGTIMVLLYLIMFGPDVRKYKDHYREIRIENELVHSFKNYTIIKKNLFPMTQVEKDGVLPGSYNKGIVRVGVEGERQNGMKVQLADIALPMEQDLGKEKNQTRVLSGCYCRMKLKKDSGLVGICLSTDNFLYPTLKEYYEKTGLVGDDLKGFTFYSETGNHYSMSEELQDAVENLITSSYGAVVAAINNDEIYCMLARRFLDPGEPDYKHENTVEALRKHYLPELEDLVQLCREAEK